MSQTTRREFTQKLALLAATPLLTSGSNARGADEPPADPIAATADALAEAARARFGKNLPEEHVKNIRQSIQRNLLSGQLMKKPPLHNGDEPAVIFRADLP